MSLRLPPSERDFEVFFKVMFHSVSTRQTAELFDISQTRVRQLVTLVGDWVAENLPDFSEADLQKQVRLAQHVAANRLEHQYEVAMRLWEAESDPKHLRQATRIALAQARLGVVAGRVHALAADVTEGPLELGDLEETARTEEPKNQNGARQEPRDGGFPGGSLGTSCVHPTNPTVGDCSLFAAQAAGGEEDASDEIAANDCPQTLIERERRLRLSAVRGAALFEGRLLSLIEGQGSANPEKVAELNETLARVRQEKAVAELRLSRFVRGVQIEALEVPPIDPAELAAR